MKQMTEQDIRELQDKYGIFVSVADAKILLQQVEV